MRVCQFDSLLPKIPVAPGLWNAHSELSNGDADSALMHLTTPAKRCGRRLDSQQKYKTKNRKPDKIAQISGGDGGIRTLDTLNTYDDLANRCLQPLGHVSVGRGFCRDLMDHASEVEQFKYPTILLGFS